MMSNPSSDQKRVSALPAHLYSFPSSSPSRFSTNPSRFVTNPPQQSQPSAESFNLNRLPAPFVASPMENPRKIELFSPQYFAGCAVGGLLACGITHLGVTPFDVAKVNIQIDPIKYSGTVGAFRTIIQEQGVRGLARGWAPTLVGYSAQGAGKYGLYEYFKKYYTDLAGPEAGKKYKTALYLAGSASAEIIADIALCPFEAVKVRVQTQPGFARGLADGLPKLMHMEGIAGIYKGMGALWARQVPYTMMKFATFENTVEAFYTHIVPYPKEECSVFTQLGISFTSGYIAGIACAVVSHPADNLVSYLNKAEGATMGQALKEMGLWTLFTRGLPLRIAMIGTLTAAQWSIYDSVKVFLGIPTTGGSSQESLPLLAS
ncbi:hypothetical protein GOP47_0021779 [Adiantum capillus-veneris]|uniref:Uncharacterized protein n=1 Tax=Adiantum capillus-veneris TaxID=13818 RepID=A0A9D4Z793_ADICA|nr:hypothetical protein GOP47_0021779 [Adiantum capillus-veneris]